MNTDTKAARFVKQMLTFANITPNGSQPWDIQVHDARFYDAVLHHPILGFGESYMKGWWDCPQLDVCVERLLKANIKKKEQGNIQLYLQNLLHVLFNFQSKKRAQIVGKHHYDIGNDLYRYMLDSRMMYTCGYWKNANNLEQAQLNKIELICQKLYLQPGMRVLDIGCGWGGFAKYAAQNYGVTVVGITISKQQALLAEQICHGLPIEIRLQDYRDLHETFDRIVSIGMLEHVGYKNYASYMQIAKRCLAPEGVFLLHTIGNNASYLYGNEWLDKYIFPNGMLPSIKQLGAAWENVFIMEDWHNFGVDYDKTLLTWHKNFNDHWDQLKANYSEEFRRMWNYYLLHLAGAARAREFQLWQIVLSHGLAGGYTSIR